MLYHRFVRILTFYVFIFSAQQYYSQQDYYKQYPQYAQPQSNGYHGYSTTPGINSNANAVQVIEVSIPSVGNFGLSKSDESIISGVIKQYLSSSQSESVPSSVPYAVAIHAYSDKKLPYSNSQYSQASNYQQPNYYQQQQATYDYNNYNYKQQQHQREVQIYEQKL